MKKISATLKSRGELTKRESQVLLLLCEGLTRQQIADQFHRSFKTINSQVESIARKLECHSAAEIVATAVGYDLVAIHISHTQSALAKFITIFLMLLNLMPSFGMYLDSDVRRGPRSPRPHRSARVSSRLVRIPRQT
mgnify:CR=1 FL=1